MVEHTQTICRQFADELFQCIWPFCGIGAQKINDKAQCHIAVLSSCVCFYEFPTIKVLLARLLKFWVDLDITTNVWKVSIFGVFLVCILPHSNWIRVISPNTGNYGSQKLRLRTRSTQCTQKWCFPFRIFLVDVHKSAESCGFIHNY